MTHDEQASLALQGIKGMWALRSGGGHATHMVLSFISDPTPNPTPNPNPNPNPNQVLSFISETRVLAMVEDELGEVSSQ